MLRYQEGGNRTTAQRAGVKTLKIGAKVGAYAVSFPPNFIAPLTHKIVEATLVVLSALQKDFGSSFTLETKPC